MAYKNQSEDELKLKRNRKYVFEHKRTREIDGFEDLKIAKTIVLSPSWNPVSDAAKALYKKEKAEKQA
jgi:hypothetical protein